MLIPFNKTSIKGKEKEYVLDAISNKAGGDGKYTELCHKWFEDNFNIKKALMVTSCTDALEMAATLINTKPGDEIICPSYTFPTSALSFVMRGASVKYVDVEQKTMNIDANLIEEAITEKTIAIVIVHYAGVSCDMDKIMAIANKHNLYVIEDAAQGVMSKYKDKYLGTIGHIGCYSFHETKNYSSGEGGLLIINDPKMIERAEILRDCGTDSAKFFRGEIPFYSWVDLGSSHLIADMNAAYLYGQMEMAEVINDDRLNTYNLYYNQLKELEVEGYIELPVVPEYATHNAHMFFIKVKDKEERALLIKYLLEHEIKSVFHYVPLHTSEAGSKYGQFIGVDKYTTIESQRLLRLPLYYGLTNKEITSITDSIKEFYRNNKNSN